MPHNPDGVRGWHRVRLFIIRHRQAARCLVCHRWAFEISPEHGANCAANHERMNR